MKTRATKIATHLQEGKSIVNFDDFQASIYNEKTKRTSKISAFSSTMYEKFILDYFNENKNIAHVKAIQHGIKAEKKAVTILKGELKGGGIETQKMIENDFCTGTPDVVHKGIPYEIKSPYSKERILQIFDMGVLYAKNGNIETGLLQAINEIEPAWITQLQVYCWLLNVPKGYLMLYYAKIKNPKYHLLEVNAVRNPIIFEKASQVFNAWDEMKKRRLDTLNIELEPDEEDEPPFVDPDDDDKPKKQEKSEPKKQEKSNPNQL